VNGHRYNGRILAREVARRHFGIDPSGRSYRAPQVVSYLLHEVTNGPEALAPEVGTSPACLVRDSKRGIVDDGILRCRAFSIRVRQTPSRRRLKRITAGDIYPVLYNARGGVTTEHDLSPHPLPRLPYARSRARGRRGA